MSTSPVPPETVPAPPAAPAAGRIRPTALAIVRRGDDLLVYQGNDPALGETFYRPLGGGIEFGEKADEAVRREMREELAVELSQVSLLSIMENIFELFGRPHHEIVFLFEARIDNPAVYEPGFIGEILDDPLPVLWKPLDAFSSGRDILYPRGLLDILAAHPVAPA
ncbi:MAG: NUDIX hydrolase [Frankia sp.]